MPKFTFTHYRISTRHWNDRRIEPRSHTIELFNKDPNNQCNRAILIFDSDLGEQTTTNMVGYLTAIDDEGASVVGWFPLELFRDWEKSLTRPGTKWVHYELRDTCSGEGYLRRLAIGREDQAVLATPTPCNKTQAPQRPRLAMVH